MLLTVTSISVAGALSVFGAKRYKEYQKKKNTPWTYHAERIKKRELAKRRSQAKERESIHSQIASLSTTLTKFSKEKISLIPYLGSGMDSRKQQLQEISAAEDESQITLSTKKEDQLLAVSIGSLLLALGGTWFYAPLSALSLLGMAYVTRDIFLGAWQGIVKEHKINLDLLDAITISLFIFQGKFIFYNVLLVYFVIRKKLSAKIKGNVSCGLIDVFRQQPRLVWLLSDGVEIEVPFETLKNDDIVVVSTGQPIPVDGHIVEGYASIDQHILTGEAQPVDRGVGEQVFALTVVLSGRICIQVEKAGAETTAAQIGQMLNEMVGFTTNLQLKAEAKAEATIVPTLLLSALAYPFLGPMGSIAILYTPPISRMTIASGIGLLNFLNIASQQSILIKDGRTLELLNEVDTVVFDKTGTLTEEQPHVGQIHTCDGYEENEILRLAAAAEGKQKHPIARAIVQKTKERSLTLPVIDDAEYKVGYGLTATINKQVVRVGSARFMALCELPIPAKISEAQTVSLQQGNSLVLIAIDEQVVGAIELHPTVRKEAAQIVKGLREWGIKSMYIISGDQEAPTQKLADSLGIDHYFAETLPKDKASLIEELQNSGKTICYIGDGINDAIALKTAHVSVSLRGAATVATDTAQVVLMDQSLNQLCTLFDLAREYHGNMTLTLNFMLYESVVRLFGVLFLNLALVPTIVMSQLSFLAGVTNTMLPLHQHNKKAERDAKILTDGS